MNKVRIGIIGAGAVVQGRHLPRLAQVPEAEVLYIWSRNPENASRVAIEFQIPNIATHWQDIVSSPDIDAVIVAPPPVLHCKATLETLKAGKHVLCQGRMSRTLEEARSMYQTAKESGLVAALYPPLPSLKGDRVMQRLLHDEDFVGEVREVRVSTLIKAEVPESYQWQADPDIVGVNTMTLGLWVEILNRWVGPATSVMAIGKTHQATKLTPAGNQIPSTVPDSLAIAATLKCGATATYHFSTHASVGPGSAIEIYGTKGALIYKLQVEKIMGATSNEEELAPITISPEEERDQTTDSEFVQAIREGTPVSPNFEDGLHYMAFSDAVFRSRQQGIAIAVEI